MSSVEMAKLMDEEITDMNNEEKGKPENKKEEKQKNASENKRKTGSLLYKKNAVVNKAGLDLDVTKLSCEKVIDLSKVKEFAKNELSVAKMMGLIWKKTLWGQKENAFFPKILQKHFCSEFLKLNYCW